MQKNARIRSVIEVLEEEAKTPYPLDSIIAKYFRARKFIGAKDKKYIAELVYNIYRRRSELLYALEQVDAALSPRNIVIAALIIIEGDAAGNLDQTFDGAKFSPEQLAISELRFAEKIKDVSKDNVPYFVTYNYPKSLEKFLKAAFEEDFEEELSALNKQASLDIRVNSLKASADKILGEMVNEGLGVSKGLYSPNCLKINSRTPIFNMKIFTDGMIEVQDEGSQLLSLLVTAKPGDKVIDFCAGAGGKTLSIAAGMKNKGRIYALDVSERRLSELKKRTTRAGVDTVMVNHIKDETDQYLKRLKDSADYVLLDVPCSGSGTWRRGPDIKWKTTPEKIANFNIVQQKILDSAKRLVKKNGQLIYATCSVFKDENENIIEKFLIDNPEFKLLNAPEILLKNYGIEVPNQKNSYLKLSPHKTVTDGFFAAVLEKNFPVDSAE
jgi:16S rRNA (cytosine967-C5)-methyltransferase